MDGSALSGMLALAGTLVIFRIAGVAAYPRRQLHARPRGAAEARLGLGCSPSSGRCVPLDRAMDASDLWFGCGHRVRSGHHRPLGAPRPERAALRSGNG